MTRITEDILAIAAAVTGNERLPLSGWQRADAIRAMHALGYSRAHIAWALLTDPRTVSDAAGRLGIRLHLYDQRHDPWAVDWVCAGIPMRLRGADRDEAVRRLGPRYSIPDIARLVGSTPQAVSTLASRLGVHTVDRRHRATA